MNQATTIEQLLGAAKREQKTKLIAFNNWKDGANHPVVFQIRELTYDEVTEIRTSNRGNDIAAAIIKSGVVEPDLKSEALQKALGVGTPYDAIRKLLKAGEVEELQMQIEKLSGFRVNTLRLLRDIEKN